MIVTEMIAVNGKDFIRTYSDRGLALEREGQVYSEAIDPAQLNRTYREIEEEHYENH